LSLGDFLTPFIFMETKKKIVNKLKGTEQIEKDFNKLLDEKFEEGIILTPYWSIDDEGNIIIDGEGILDDCYEKIRELNGLADEQNN